MQRRAYIIIYQNDGPIRNEDLNISLVDTIALFIFIFIVFGGRAHMNCSFHNESRLGSL